MFWLDWRSCDCSKLPTRIDARVDDMPLAEIVRAGFLLFVMASFLHFFGFLVGGLSIHINFSTSAAICASGDYVGDRNRVTG